MTADSSAAYIVAALLFILSLAGLSKHESAKSGNTFGIAGMGIALVTARRSASASTRSGRRHGIGLLARLIRGRPHRRGHRHLAGQERRDDRACPS